MKRSVVASPSFVDALDQHTTDVAREVEVDVGERVHPLVQEAADVEAVLHRVDVREPDQVADDRGDGRTAAAAGRLRLPKEKKVSRRAMRPGKLRRTVFPSMEAPILI